jgi:hypothetical protein
MNLIKRKSKSKSRKIRKRCNCDYKVNQLKKYYTFLKKMEKMEKGDEKMKKKLLEKISNLNISGYKMYCKIHRKNPYDLYLKRYN